MSAPQLIFICVYVCILFIIRWHTWTKSIENKSCSVYTAARLASSSDRPVCRGVVVAGHWFRQEPILFSVFNKEINLSVTEWRASYNSFGIISIIFVFTWSFLFTWLDRGGRQKVNGKLTRLTDNYNQTIELLAQSLTNWWIINKLSQCLYLSLA